MASGALTQRGFLTRRTTAPGSGFGGMDMGPGRRQTVFRGQVGETLGGTIGERFGGDTGRDIGTILGGFIEDRLSSGNRPGGATPSSFTGEGQGQGPCPAGTINLAGRCLDLMPGGQTQGQGVFVDPVNGNGGGSPMPGGVSPGVFSSIKLRCPEGMVLARNNLCYHKAALPKKWRKWKPAPKPPISASDAKAIRRADAAKNRVKRLAMKSGFTCKRK